MAQIDVKNIDGKGNIGMYVDRFPAIYAAGIRSLQPEVRVADCFNNYLAPDVINDFEKKDFRFPQCKLLRYPETKDMRNAGPFTEGAPLISPPVKTKFQTLVEDLKCTVYKSYWNNEVGKGPNRTLASPPNLDINNITFGKKSIRVDNLYDVILPNVPKDVLSSRDRRHKFGLNDCTSNLNVTHDKTEITGISGQFAQCCLTDDRIELGTSLKKPLHIKQVNYRHRNCSELGKCLTPNDNIDRVPEGYVFGVVETKDNILGCMTNSELNFQKDLIKNCLAHLNTLRKCLSKRKYDRTFFSKFYLQLKYLDSSQNGWLPKHLIYISCKSKHIRINPKLLEPLLCMWDAIRNANVDYKIFIDIINYKEPLPTLPKAYDVLSEHTNFTTTYMEMVTPEQADCNTAEINSEKYSDVQKVDNMMNLPLECDAKACLRPSIFTSLGISPQDMYAKREPDIIKKVFKLGGKNVNEDMFNAVWKIATQYHPKKIVCFETFRRALKEYNNNI